MTAFVFFAGDAWAARARFEDFSGVDQRFTRGYGYRRFTDTAHDSATYELLIPDDIKDKEAESALVEEERHRDVWRYSRTALYAVTYDSNIGNTAHDPVDDLIHNYSGTFAMARRGQRDYVNLFYNVNYTHQVEDEKASAITHEQLTNFGYTLGRLKIDVTNRFSPQAAVSTGERSELDTLGTSRVTAINEDLDFRVSYKAGAKTNVGFGYKAALFYLPVRSNSLTANSLSTLTETYSPTVSYKISPKLTVFGSYTWEFIRYPRGGTQGSRSVTPRIGLSGRIGKKIFFNGSVAYVGRHYDQPGTPDSNHPQYEFSVTRKLTEKISLTALTRKSTEENLDSLTGSIEEDKTFYGLELTWKMRPKLSLNLGGSVGYQESEGLITNTDEENPTLAHTRAPGTQTYEWGSTLQWDFRRWASALLGYQYTNQNGSFKQDEYEDHRLLSTVNARF